MLIIFLTCGTILSLIFREDSKNFTLFEISHHLIEIENDETQTLINCINI